MKKVIAGIALAWACISTATAADKPLGKNLKQEKPVAQPAPTFEEAKATAMREVDDFAKAMQVADKAYPQKQEKIISAIPVIAALFPPSQWAIQVKFLYSALTEIDRQAAMTDPDAVLSRFFADEQSRVPEHVFQNSASLRTAAVENRLGELETQLNNGSMDQMEHAARALAVALSYFPNDQRFVSMRRYKLDLAVKLNRGDIDQARFDMLWAIKRAEDTESRANQRRATESQQAALEAQQQAEDSQRWRDAVAAGLKGWKDSVSIQRQPVTCLTTGNVTSCR